MSVFDRLFGAGHDEGRDDRTAVGPADPPPSESPPPPEDLVRDYLRAQNLEQVGRTEDAVLHYERAVLHGFDSAGPYDRLIAIYRSLEAHGEVARVAEAALTYVRTYPDRRGWYERMRQGAEEALASQPDPKGPEF